MKTFKVLLACLLLGAIYFYNTNWFQSFFLYDRFYQTICDAPFDVTTKGETISIPLKYKYKTCYELAVTVPDKNVFHDRLIGPGLLAYKFVSDGRLLGEGLSHAPDRHQLLLNNGITSIVVMVFDLPFAGEANNLVLELEVVEPFDFLKPYSGSTRCQIAPNYDAKLGRCVNEQMSIDR